MSNQAKRLWDAVKPEAAKRLGEHVAKSWLSQIEAAEIADGVFKFETAGSLAREWVRDRYAEDLLLLMRQKQPDIQRIEITVIKQLMKPVEATAAEKQKISFVHAGLCQVFFPRQKSDARRHERSSGAVSLLIKAGEIYHKGKFVEVPLPYGGKARSFMTEIQTQVAKTGSTTIDLDRSMRAFATKHGIDPNGRNLKMLGNQAVHLGSAEILLGYHDALRGDTTLGGKVARQISIWAIEDDQPALWPNTLELSTDFRDAIVEHHVPISSAAMHALDHNALAQDFYCFFGYRLHVLNPAKPTYIPWAFAYQQFEGERFDPITKKLIPPEKIQSYYPWRKRAIQAIGQALEQYPAARVEMTRDHLIMRNSPPPVPKILTSVAAIS